MSIIWFVVNFQLLVPRVTLLRGKDFIPLWTSTRCQESVQGSKKPNERNKTAESKYLNSFLLVSLPPPPLCRLLYFNLRQTQSLTNQLIYYVIQRLIHCGSNSVLNFHFRHRLLLHKVRWCLQFAHTTQDHKLTTRAFISLILKSSAFFRYFAEVGTILGLHRWPKKIMKKININNKARKLQRQRQQHSPLTKLYTAISFFAVLPGRTLLHSGLEIILANLCFV